MSAGANAANTESRAGQPHGGILGLPADLRIATDGTVLARKYGNQWTVDELLHHAR